MLKRIKQWFSRTSGEKTQENKAAKQAQLKRAGILFLILLSAVGFYKISERPHERQTKALDETHFDGVFDSQFHQGSDEALIEKQQHQIDALSDAMKAKDAHPTALVSTTDEATLTRLKAMQEKLDKLEAANRQTNEQLQAALLKSTQVEREKLTPPTREEMAEKLAQRQQAARAMFARAGLESVHFQHRKKNRNETHTANNYVWAGTFAEGVLLTGILGDAGINGAKNMGTAMIRLTSNGIMPNDKQSHLNGCFALVSTFGDLSGSSVVLHLETLSCASKNINFEQKAYGSVFDLDAMQDLRGTSVLKTKPLLSYTAAAGALAGFGDGLKAYGTAQSVNPGAGTVTMFNTGQSIAQSAAGGALSNPANRISDYIMRIADLYHPLVVAKAGRRVSVLFTKGFWIDKEHQVYESGRAMEETPEPSRNESLTTSSNNAMPMMSTGSTQGSGGLFTDVSTPAPLGNDTPFETTQLPATPFQNNTEIGHE
jgi:conjugal transfer pilus assembly protein TraB